MDTNDEDFDYKVVLNHEEQYSIWPADRENPPGWTDEGTQGPKAACLEHIKTIWTDMRPLSLRLRMEALARDPPPPEADADDDDPTPPLVDRLADGAHPVEISIRPERTIAALKACLGRDYVHVKFTGTRGGTELGVRLDREACTFPSGLDAGVGTLHLEGRLTLDYEPVRCVADIDLATMVGEGRLVRDAAVPA